ERAGSQKGKGRRGESFARPGGIREQVPRIGSIRRWIGSRGPTLRDGEADEACLRSGPKGTIGAEWRQVGRRIKQPESLPIVAGLPEVFRVDEQFFNSPGLVGRIVRQRDRRTALEQRERSDHDCQGRRSFRISGSSRLRYRSDQSVRSLLERVRS